MAFSNDGDDTSQFTRWHQPPTRSEWEEHKAIIQGLYIEDNMTLHELVKTMSTAYNFYASQVITLRLLCFLLSLPPFRCDVCQPAP